MKRLQNQWVLFLLAILFSSLGRISHEQDTNDENHRVNRDVGDGATIPDCSGCDRSALPSCISGQTCMCPQGTPGPVGPPGQQGIPGRDGRDGRDSVERQGCSTSSSSPSSSSSGGAVYVRWGRYECPDQSILVYSGIAGGTLYSQSGGASNYVCMPNEPIYDNPTAGVEGGRGYLYGAEYQINHLPEWNHLHDHDVPCAVCKASSRTSLLMIPARNVCPSGNWVKEYSGYLMTASHDHAGRTEYVCVDRDPQIIPRTPGNADGVLFYPVEGRCGRNGNDGLPCGPYVDGYELTCAVCTQ